MRHPRDHRQRHRQLRISSVRRKGMAVGGISLDAYAWRLDLSKLLSSGAEGLPDAPGALSPRAEDSEVEVARAQLDQADHEMALLKSRIDYLEARAASSVGATQNELEELMQVRDELADTSANVGGLSKRLEQLSREPGSSVDRDGWDDY